VKFSFERLCNPEVSEFINTGKSITSIDIIDDYTVVIKTKEPIPWLANNLYKILVMDEESIEARDPGEMEARPIGSGAYKFCEIGRRF
jgi:peptide/nickel transport system substrate-binding protein